MKNVIIEMKGSLHDKDIQHAIVDLSDLAGYDLPWMNDDISLDDDRKGTVTMKIYSGYNEKALTRGGVETIAERWSLGMGNVSFRVESDEDEDEDEDEEDNAELTLYEDIYCHLRPDVPMTARELVREMIRDGLDPKSCPRGW